MLSDIQAVKLFYKTILLMNHIIGMVLLLLKIGWMNLLSTNTSLVVIKQHSIKLIQWMPKWSNHILKI